MYRKDLIVKMGLIEQEYRAAALAISDLLRRVLRDPSVLDANTVVPGDLRSCRDNLEITYVVRMFAVFEEGLREARRVVHGKDRPIRTYDLLQQCAARQHIPYDHLSNVHRVREYRNAALHGGRAPIVPLAQARSWLCTFAGWMPPRW